MYLADAGLDYAIVGLTSKARARLKRRGVRDLRVASAPVRIGDPVVIVQHPNGGPREVSVDNVTDLFSTFITYQCETAAGSSGSPVLRAWEVVAMHHERAAERAVRGVHHHVSQLSWCNKAVLVQTVLTHAYGQLRATRLGGCQGVSRSGSPSGWNKGWGVRGTADTSC